MRSRIRSTIFKHAEVIHMIAIETQHAVPIQLRTSELDATGANGIIRYASDGDRGHPR